MKYQKGEGKKKYYNQSLFNNIYTNLDQKIKIYLQNWWKPEVLGEKPSNLQKNYIESSTIMTFFMIQNWKIHR